METLMDGGGVFIVQEQETWKERIRRSIKGKSKSDQAPSDGAQKPEVHSSLRRRFKRGASQSSASEIASNDSDDEFAHLSIPELHAMADELKRKIAAEQAKSLEDAPPPLPPRPLNSRGFCVTLQGVIPIISSMAPFSPKTSVGAGANSALMSAAVPAHAAIESAVTNAVAVLPQPSMVASYVPTDATQRGAAVSIHI